MRGLSPRRSARRSFVILFAIVSALLLGEHLRTPLGGAQTNSFGKKLRKFPSTITRPRMRVPVAAEGVHRKNHARTKFSFEEDEDGYTGSLEEHFYKANGLLEVNVNGPHPIFELIRRAEGEWQDKLNRASKTLEQAVAEYQRRYKRLPPLGFDEWWVYVEEHNVQLPDEYDQIHNDLEPFWGMDPKDLQKIQRDWEAHFDSFTVGKDSIDEPISLKNYSLTGSDISRDGLAKGAYEIMELLEEVAGSIPPFRAVFSPHDNPNLPTDFELMEQALRAAAAGTYIDIDKPPPVKHNGWLSGCSPRSPARKQRMNWGGAPKPQSTKTFIYDHHLSMDPCQHPTHLLLHGQFISHRRGPVPHRTLIPQFSYAPTMLHHDMTPAMPINWLQDIEPREDDPEWEERWDARLQWRGSNTGMWHAEDTRWDLAQRARLVRWAGDGYEGRGWIGNGRHGHGGLSENMTVLMPTEEDRRVGRGVEVRKALWSPAMVDIAFAGDPLNCSPEMCKKLGKIFEYRRQQTVGAAGRYKYVIDVDGNGWSSRFKRLITSNALVFKSTVYPEWYTERVAPWIHYIPIQVDLSDLWDTLVFFRGDPVGNGAHDELAKKIAQAGREWSKTFWRREDMVAYMFRLFLEYARVMDPDRRSYDPSNPRMRDASLRRRRQDSGSEEEKIRANSESVEVEIDNNVGA